MKIILLLGGYGKRLWPISKKDKPKKFLPLIEGKPLSRLKFDYLLTGFSPSDIFISTGEVFKDFAHELFPEVPKENFIFEHTMRDNGPAVLLVASYIKSLYPGE